MIIAIVSCRISCLSVESEGESQGYACAELEVELKELGKTDGVYLEESSGSLGQIGLSDDTRDRYG